MWWGRHDSYLENLMISLCGCQHMFIMEDLADWVSEFLVVFLPGKPVVTTRISLPISPPSTSHSLLTNGPGTAWPANGPHICMHHWTSSLFCLTCSCPSTNSTSFWKDLLSFCGAIKQQQLPWYPECCHHSKYVLCLMVPQTFVFFGNGINSARTLSTQLHSSLYSGIINCYYTWAPRAAWGENVLTEICFLLYPELSWLFFLKDQHQGPQILEMLHLPPSSHLPRMPPSLHLPRSPPVRKDLASQK